LSTGNVEVRASGKLLTPTSGFEILIQRLEANLLARHGEPKSPGMGGRAC